MTRGARVAVRRDIRRRKACTMNHPPREDHTMASTLYDEEHWDVEPADPSTGIWTHAWSHQTCPNEYEQGVQEESTLANRHVRNGCVYADETYTLTCLDCGATTSFTDQTLMGFEGEQGV